MAVKAKHARAADHDGVDSTSRSQIIAWQGLILKVPSAWSLVAASGDFTAGSTRIEHTGTADSNEPLGLEIRWSEVNQEQSANDLDRRIKPLLDSAEKAGKRAKINVIETNVAAYADRRHGDRGIVREFFWRSEGSGFGRIWRCETCSRLTIAQVYGKAGSRYLDSAKEILAGICCHNADQNSTRWALYGLDVAVPSEYLLSGQQLMNIYLELRFNKGRVKHGDAITVEQWSAANVQLKGQYLDQFIERKANSLQKSVDMDSVESSVGDHPALAMIGNRGGIGFWIGDAVKQMVALHAPVRNFGGIAWECPESNKVYMVQSLTTKSEPDLCGEVAGRVRCHAAAVSG